MVQTCPVELRPRGRRLPITRRNRGSFKRNMDCLIQTRRLEKRCCHATTGEARDSSVLICVSREHFRLPASGLQDGGAPEKAARRQVRLPRPARRAGWAWADLAMMSAQLE